MQQKSKARGWAGIVPKVFRNNWYDTILHGFVMGQTRLGVREKDAIRDFKKMFNLDEESFSTTTMTHSLWKRKKEFRSYLTDFEYLTDIKESFEKPDFMKMLYNELPDDQFKRSWAVKIGVQMGISAKSVDRYLQMFCFKKVKKGWYIKSIFHPDSSNNKDPRFKGLTAIK